MLTLQYSVAACTECSRLDTEDSTMESRWNDILLNSHHSCNLTSR